MNEPAARQPILEVKNATKRFPGVVALNNVSLTVYEGEVLSVIGENGAGKSTLMKILAGIQLPDEGEIILRGRKVHIDSCRTAGDLGIALIHQELNLADNLDVGSNIFLGREPLKLGLIDTATIYAESERFLKLVGLNVSPQTIVSTLAIGHQQMVEIAKALSVNARILIMDEPTSSLSSEESQALFSVIRDLRQRGVSIIYISHRLGEVREVSDRVTVLRDGENAGDLAKDQITHDAMVNLMVGRDVSQFYSRGSHEPGPVRLEVLNLQTSAYPRHKLNLSVRAGEIVGLAGLLGAGRTELLEVIFGIEPPVGGQIRVNDVAQDFKQPLDAIRAGIALVPEDRKQHGLIQEMAVAENIGLPGLERHSQRFGILNQAKEDQDTDEMIRKLRIRTPSAQQPTQFLSGGNQQKVVLGKWLALEPAVLLLDEPTRGIDVGAKEEIYRLMDQLAAQGVAILFVSSEMEEIMGMSDRVLVMHEGRISGELTRDAMSEAAVMQLATGNIVAA